MKIWIDTVSVAHCYQTATFTKVLIDTVKDTAKECIASRTVPDIMANGEKVLNI